MAAKKNEVIRPVIVKKIIVAGHAGHHGGAWKVAYADFVTAMMAFFLLMWLLGATNEKQRKALADYFAPTLVQTKDGSAGSDGFFGGDSIVSVDSYPNRAGQTGTRTITIPKDATGGPKEGGERTKDRERFAKMKLHLEKDMKARTDIRRFAKNIRFTETREGLRIELVDEADFTMFMSGTDRMTPDALNLLAQVASVVAEVPNGLIIRGHTDSLPYPRGVNTNNWVLSTSRAEATRRLLTQSGVDPRRFNRIEGVADREPYVPDDRLDPRNRRMSITLGWANTTQTIP
jgi:chemotaxis protein MotB